jgi:hypothetical protein
MARDVRRIALCVLASAMVMVSGGLSLSTTALADDIPGSPVQTPSPVQSPIPTPSPTPHPAAPPATPTAGPQVAGGPAPVSSTDTPPAPISSPLITGGEILWIHSGPSKQDPVVGSYDPNALVTVDCQGYGDAVWPSDASSNLWDETASGWISDLYVANTPSETHDDALPWCAGSTPVEPH